MQVASRHPVPSALTQAAQSLGSTRGDAGQLRRGFDRSLIPMVIVDNDRRHVEVNAAARLLARMSLRELRGLRIDDLTAEGDLPGLHAAWEKLFERGTLSDRYAVRFKDGSTLWLYYEAIVNALPGQHLIAFVPADWPGDELEELQPAAQRRSPSRLSPRQVEVLRLVAIGGNANQIAQELSISEATVRTHVKNILERLGARNRAHAVALALGAGVFGDLTGLVGAGGSPGGSDQSDSEVILTGGGGGQ